MIPRWIVNFVDGVRGLMRFPPVVIDGALYVSIAAFTALQSSFGSDEAIAIMGAKTLFWIKTSLGTLLASCLALKMFRSTSYSEHVKPKNGSGGTEFFVNPKPPTTPTP